MGAGTGQHGRPAGTNNQQEAQVAMASQTDVVVVDDKDIEAYSPKLLSLCREQDPQEVVKRFARRFDKANTLDELFDVLQGTNSQQLVGKVLDMRGVEWAPYQAKRPSGEEVTIPLAIVAAFDLEDGAEMEYATTSTMLCMFLYKVSLIDAFPFQAKIVGKKTNSGQVALNFERV